MRLAWHIAILERQKKIPPLKELLVSHQRHTQTDTERRAVFEDIRARLGFSSKRVRLVRREVVH